MAGRKRSPHHPRFDCYLVLNKPRLVYFAGETIYGKAYVTSYYVQSIRDISVTLQGITKVHWIGKQHLCAGFFLNKTYKSSKEHIHRRQSLNEIFVLDEGRYLFDFEFLLPTEMPSSTEESYGRTRYEITLVVSSRYEFSLYKRAITILKSFDLNLYPEYKRTIDTEICKMPFNKPCKSAYVVSLKIDQKAYAPGQTMDFVLRVDNEFEEINIDFILFFVKKVTYRTNKKNMTHEHKLLIKIFEGFKTNENNIDFYGNFKVPTTPPTTNILNIITIEYFLNVSLTLPTHDELISISVPVIIGTKPIQKKRSVKIRKEEIYFKEAAADEVKIYDLDDDDDIPTTSQAARAAAERAKEQKSKFRRFKKPKAIGPEIDNQPRTSQAARTAAQIPGEEETEFKEAAADELKIIDLEKYSDDEPTTLQAADRAREQEIEKKELVKKKVKKSEVAYHEIDNQPSTSQAARAAAERSKEKGREKIKEKKIDIYYDYYSQEPVYETSVFDQQPFIDDDYEEEYRIGIFEPIYPVYRSPSPSRRSNKHK